MAQMLAPSAARDFSSDIAYLLDPPLYLSHIAVPLETALREIIRLSRDFSRGVNYIRGCEDILAQVRSLTEARHEINADYMM
jgi:hypothetical protein